MSSHTAHQELIGLLQNAGVSPEQVIRFNGLLAAKPELHAWLNTPNGLRVSTLAEHGQASARTALNAGGAR